MEKKRKTLSTLVYLITGSTPSVKSLISSSEILDTQLLEVSRRLPSLLMEGEGNGNPIQYSCLENPMDRGSWQATAHGVTKSQTRLSVFTF